MIKSEDSVAASLVLGIIKAAEHIGLSTDCLLESSGISLAQLEGATTRLNFDQFYLFIQSLEQDNEGNIGIRLGSELGIASFNALGYAAAHGNTLADALQLIPKYESLVMTLGSTQILFQERLVYVLWSMKKKQKSRLLEDLFLASWLTLAQLYCGKKLIDDNKTEVQFFFTHTEPCDRADWTAIFGRSIYFNQSHAKVVFCQELLSIPLLQTDPFVHNLMIKEAENLSSNLSAALIDQVNTWLLIELAKGEPEFRKLANHLSMSERTLRRRLKEEGHGFKTLLNELRKERADYYLQNNDLSLWEVSERLGYKQLTTFNAAYKRWTGKTPASQRRN